MTFALANVVPRLRQRSGMSPEQSGFFSLRSAKGEPVAIWWNGDTSLVVLCLTFRCRSIKLAAGEPWTAAAGPFPWP